LCRHLPGFVAGSCRGVMSEPRPPDLTRYTYADPFLSLWQSAAKEVRTSQESTSLGNALEIGQGRDLMWPAQRVYEEATDSTAAAAEIFESEGEPEGVVTDCASLAAKFLWAEVSGNKVASQLYADELNKAVCDAGGWSTCLTTYLKFKASAGNWPYRENVDSDLPLPGQTIGIIGDWGTGEHAAANVLEELKKLSPSIVIHLGDIYYSGTMDEVRDNFLSLCRSILGEDVPVLSLCGNHDMYSGGAGYYWLIDQLGQPASYFCLRNDKWQILAMDTGHSDGNPFTVSTNMTQVAVTEVVWLKQKIADGKGRKTILLSHHQLFSAFGSVGRINDREYAYNRNLYEGLKDIFGKVEWWFWGHEHNLALYDPYMGLKRGRCLGCSAVPVFVNQQSYELKTDLATLDPGNFPSWRVDAQLGNNGTDYSHAFALLRLSEKDPKAEYYEVPVGGTARLLCVEKLIDPDTRERSPGVGGQ